MSEVTLTADTGRTTGSRSSRRLRGEGVIPGVIYGSGEPAATVSFRYTDLRDALNTDAGRNALVRMTLGDESFLTLVNEIQLHPVRREITHIDFLKVDPRVKVEVEVPIHLVGEPKQVLVNGGMVEQKINALMIEVRPDAIPNGIDVDISEMEIDQSITVADLELPEGAESLIEGFEPVATAEITRAAVAEDEEGVEGEDGETEGGDAEGSADASDGDSSDE